MKTSIDKLAVEYMGTKEDLFLVLNYFESLDYTVRQWSEEISPYYRNASVKDKNGDGLFIGYHVKRVPPLYMNGKYFNALRIQFNPNKVSIRTLEGIRVLHRVLGMYGWTIPRVDVAFDFPTKLDNILVISKTARKKRPPLYETTDYYGKRESDGSLKVYDKALEMYVKYGVKVDGPLTRVEYTYKPKSKEGREIGGLLIEEDLRRRYHILNLENADDKEKTTLLCLVKRKKSSLSKKQREELATIIEKHVIRFNNVNFQTTFQVMKLIGENLNLLKWVA
jgi:hypothetical protein